MGEIEGGGDGVTQPLLEFGTRILQLIGKVIDGPKVLLDVTMIASCSVAQWLLELVRRGEVTDISHIKCCLTF